MAGNEITLDPTFQTVVPLRPLHLWWLPVAQATMDDGPQGRDTTDPVFTWGLERNNGQNPQDPAPCPPNVQFYVFKLDLTGTVWEDISGGWSQWQNPANRTITLDSFFNPTTRLRALIAAAGGEPNRQYLMVLRGYDEAGNLQTFDLFGNPVPAVYGNLLSIPALAWNVWGDPGVSAAAALDTKIQPVFWHNVRGDRVLDPGERSFGAATRVPLPAAEVACTVRVEAGFTITMEASDAVTAGDVIGFQLYEDGRFAASGRIDPSALPAGPFSLVIPQDLLVPPTGLTLDPGYLAFLNESPCPDPVDLRLGDDGEPGSESAFRKRNVKYQLLCATGVIDPISGNYVFDTTPATVEFTVTVDRALKDEQPIKSFSKE
jgi:hypothetical protein